MNRSKKLKDSIRLKTAWSPYDQPDSYQNTFDYEKFKGNKMGVEDYKFDPEDMGQFAKGESIATFVKGLQEGHTKPRIEQERFPSFKELVDKVKNKKNYRGEVSAEQLIKDANEEEELQQEDLEAEKDFLDDVDSSDVPENLDINPDDYLPGPINQGEYEPMPPVMGGELSPLAKEDIYRLHLQGWSVA